MSAAHAHPKAGPRGGFSLIELVATLLVIVAVTGIAIAGYVDVSSNNLRAADLTRDARRATAILDRVARDLEAVRLAEKPPERDPLEHPWLFLAESRGLSEGADRLKFVTRGQRPAADDALASDVGQVAWLTSPALDGSLDLLRWGFPRLSEGLDRRLPRDDDPGVFLVAEGIEEFGVRLMDEAGEWTDRWDSSELARSSQLPLVAEIRVLLVPEDPDADVREPFVRRVVLPVRPFNLEAQLAGDDAPNAEAEESQDEEDASEDECLRVRDCIDATQIDAELMEIILELQDQCLSDVGVPPGAVLPQCQGGG